jgi:hypothetical protein
MIKKIVICFALFHLTFQMNAQFFRGVGLFVGGTTSSHRYKNLNAKDLQLTLAHAISCTISSFGRVTLF